MIEPAQDPHIAAKNPDGHPAVDAWLTLDPGNRKPVNVFSLYAAREVTRKNRDRRKSAVYRLDGAGQAGTSIVAKLCNPETAELECIIYEQIIARMPISSLQYYGHMETGGSHWLFIEYADGVEWDINNKAHLDLAIQWMADMHGSSAHIDTLSLLPRRGPDYYLSQLTIARKRILENISNPALDAASTRILDEFIACSSLLETRWEEIDAFCKTVPETLTHNDFVSKNVHVRDTNSGPMLLVFDWEMSGRGVPANDLFWLFHHAPESSISRYWQHRRKFNSGIALQDIEYLAIIGAIFRITDAVEWGSQYLLTEYPDRKMHHTSLYIDRLKQAFHALEWC